MVKPKFTKADNVYSVLTMERGRTFDSYDEYVPNQIKNESGSGYSQTVTISKTKRYIYAPFKAISATNKDNLIGFLDDTTVDWLANPFEFTDEYGVDYDVEYVSGSLKVTPNKNYTFNVSLLMRVL